MGERSASSAHKGGREVQVGVGVLILRDNRVLLGRRLGSHGAGSWAPPGGHLDFGESVEQCAQREVFEETGLTVGDVTRGPYTTNMFPDQDRHFVTLFMVARNNSGEPAVMEPAKCEGWEWFDWNELPAPLFAPLQSLLDMGFVRTLRR